MCLLFVFVVKCVLVVPCALFLVDWCLLIVFLLLSLCCLLIVDRCFEV